MQLQQLAAQRLDLVNLYEEQIAEQNERLQKADEMITMLEIRGDMDTDEKQSVVAETTVAASGQLLALQQQTQMQRQITQVVEDATKREEELREQLREARVARNDELQRIETRLKENAATAAVRMEAAHEKVVAVLREAHTKELETVQQKLSEAQEAYRSLQLDAQAHMAAAQALTAERDRLKSELSKRTQKVKQLKKTVQAGQSVTANQQKLQIELRAKAEHIERTRVQIRNAKQKLKDHQAAVRREIADKQRLMEQEAARIAEDSRLLKEQRAQAREAATSAAQDLQKRETLLRQQLATLQEKQRELAERTKLVQLEAANAAQLREAVTDKARELDSLHTKLVKEAARIDKADRAAASATQKSESIQLRLEDAESDLAKREAVLQKEQKEVSASREELKDERRALEQLRQTALLERRQAMVKMKAADRYKSSMARSQGALMLRTLNNGISNTFRDNKAADHSSHRFVDGVE